MSDFSEQLAAARAARPYRDVPVVLDGALSRELDSLQAQLEVEREAGDADERLGVESRIEELESRVKAVVDAARESIVTLRFYRLPGRDWAAITSKWPARPDVPIDRHYGYDYDSVCEEAATKSGARLVDGETVPLIVEPIDIDDPGKPVVNEWRDLFDVLSGRDIQQIRDAQWALNEYEPQRRLDELVKGFGAATRSDEK